MSIFLNIVSAVLILPLVAFSLFFLSVDMISGGPAGHWFGRMLDILFFLLPDPGNPISAVVALLAMVLLLAGLVYLMIRFVFVYPLIMLVLGVLTLVFITLDVSTPPSADDLLLWAGALGILASGVQLKRSLFRRARAA